MAQYLVAIYRPDDYDPSVETEATIEEIYALNRELIAAGARKFACGRQRQLAAGPSPTARCSSPTAVHREQGAHWRFLDT